MTVGILSLETHSSEIQNSPLTCSTLCDCQAALAHCSRVIQPQGQADMPSTGGSSSSCQSHPEYEPAPAWSKHEGKVLRVVAELPKE